MLELQTWPKMSLGMAAKMLRHRLVVVYRLLGQRGNSVFGGVILGLRVSEFCPGQSNCLSFLLLLYCANVTELVYPGRNWRDCVR